MLSGYLMSGRRSISDPVLSQNIQRGGDPARRRVEHRLGTLKRVNRQETDHGYSYRRPRAGMRSFRRLADHRRDVHAFAPWSAALAGCFDRRVAVSIDGMMP